MGKNFSIDLKAVGHRIKNARTQLGLTQEAVAERTELSGQYWSLIENGRYRGSISTYLQMATAVGLTLNDLFYDEAEVIRVKPAHDFRELLAGMSESEKYVMLHVLDATKAALILARDLQ